MKTETQGAMPQKVQAGLGRILVVDDRANMVKSLEFLLSDAGYEVRGETNPSKALEAIGEESFDVVLSDLRMDGIDGLALLKEAAKIAPNLPIIIMTAFGSVDTAVAAMQAGAYDYVQKPTNDKELLVKVERAVERRRLLTQVRLLSDEFQNRYRLENIVGRSLPMRELLSRLLRVAATDATVLISGESGTGKELIARALHVNSRRAGEPFVPMNCTAIPEHLLESELFGQAQGPYSEDARSRRGLLEEASGGTFFFDEIAETSLSFQAKLLRAIQENEIRRVGENISRPIDVRIIAATNVDLRQAVAEKKFRQDLYYRLNVVPLRVPPLRERKDDIGPLAEHFLTQFNRRNGSAYTLSEGALKRLLAYDFPGNVRELENLIQQAAALAPSDQLGPEDILLDTQQAAPLASDDSLAAAVDEAERAAILRALDKTGGDQEEACRILRVSATTLWRKMKRLNISR